MNFRKLAIAATAFGLIAGGASAQEQADISVLERVLGLATAANGVTGSIMANIASTNVDVLNDVAETVVGNIDGTISVTLNNIGADPAGNLTNVYEEIDQQIGTSVLTTRTEIDAIVADLGAISTTVLGAVNTGDMNLTGSVSTVTDTIDKTTSDAVAGLSTAMADVDASIYAVTAGVLGDANNPVQMLNIADNVASITGGVTITADSVSTSAASIGTTVLGAVNTGTITQNAATNVAGVVSSITGR